MKPSQIHDGESWVRVLHWYSARCDDPESKVLEWFLYCSSPSKVLSLIHSAKADLIERLSADGYVPSLAVLVSSGFTAEEIAVLEDILGSVVDVPAECLDLVTLADTRRAIENATEPLRKLRSRGVSLASLVENIRSFEYADDGYDFIRNLNTLMDHISGLDFEEAVWWARSARSFPVEDVLAWLRIGCRRVDCEKDSLSRTPEESLLRKFIHHRGRQETREDVDLCHRLVNGGRSIRSALMVYDEHGRTGLRLLAAGMAESEITLVDRWAGYSIQEISEVLGLLPNRNVRDQIMASTRLTAPSLIALLKLYLWTVRKFPELESSQAAQVVAIHRLSKVLPRDGLDGQMPTATDLLPFLRALAPLVTRGVLEEHDPCHYIEISANWARSGLKPADLRTWLVSGFSDPREVLQWQKAGVGAAEAARRRDSGLRAPIL